MTTNPFPPLSDSVPQDTAPAPAAESKPGVKSSELYLSITGIGAVSQVFLSGDPMTTEHGLGFLAIALICARYSLARALSKRAS